MCWVAGAGGGQSIGHVLRMSPFAPKNRELQIMRKLDHCNIVRLRYFFYSSGEKVRSRGECGEHPLPP